MEQKQNKITVFLPINGKIVNKNDFKCKTPKNNNDFAILFHEFLC